MNRRIVSSRAVGTQQAGSKRESRAREAYVLRLAGTPSPDALAFARRCSANAVREGVANICIELDALTTLDPVIGTLISILRDANESSAEVILWTGRDDFRKALRVTALDTIFTLETPPASGV